MNRNVLEISEKFIVLLILFLPIALIAGSFFTNFIISIVAIYSILLFVLKTSIKKFFFHKVSILIFLFSFYLILSSLLSEDRYFSLSSTLFYSRFLLFSIGFAYLLEKNINFVNWFGYSLWLCIAIVTIDGYFQFINGFNLLGWEKYDPVRISGFFREELILGSYLSRLLPLCFMLIFFLKKEYSKKIFFISFCILLILIDVLIYLSGERTAFLFLFLATLSIILTIPNFRIIRILTFGISLLAIVLISINNTTVRERMVNFTLEQSGIINGPNYNDTDFNKFNAFSPAHQLHYESAYYIFIDSPIFGQGPKMFRKLCQIEKYKPEGCSTHPHHTYMQLLAETGIIGAASILLIFFIISFKLFKQFIFLNFLKKNYLDSRVTLLLISFLITLWPIAPSANFFGSWINSIYYLPLGFYLFLTKDSRLLLYPKKTSIESEEKKKPTNANK